MSEQTYTGSCLCGSISYQITGPFKVFQYCHCSRCRKITGSAFSPNIFVPPHRFQWLSGENLLSRYEHPKARYFTTCFCSRCGSTLPWTVKTGVNVVVPAGTLNEKPDIEPLQNIFWDSRAPWFREPAELECFSEFPKR
ncbi:MAG TPA: GFA family protein [Gammaproteobacteria bacterium]